MTTASDVTLDLANPTGCGRVVRELRRLISQGAVSARDPLPSERKLGEQFGVGRNVVRRALKQLSDEGLLLRDGPRALVVAPGAAPAGSPWLSQAIAYLDPLYHDRGRDPQNEYWTNYVTMGVGQAIRGAGRHGIGLNPFELKADDVRRLAADGPLGVLVPEVFVGGDETLRLVRMLADAGVRVVVYGGQPELDGFDRVASDHAAGEYELTRWLIAQGRTRVAPVFPMPASGYWFAHRLAGYERAMREAGLEPRKPILTVAVPKLEYVMQHGQEPSEVFAGTARHVAGYLIEHFASPASAPDAFVCGSDRDTFALAAACRLFGKVPGRDVLIAGYDNYFDHCGERRFEPQVPAATMDKQNDLMGREMVRLLLDRAGGKLPPGPQLRAVPPRLVVAHPPG
jgi:DNA-binding LacI/PurR family transcriptional regulator